MPPRRFRSRSQSPGPDGDGPARLGLGTMHEATEAERARLGVPSDAVAVVNVAAGRTVARTSPAPEHHRVRLETAGTTDADAAQIVAHLPDAATFGVGGPTRLTIDAAGLTADEKASLVRRVVKRLDEQLDQDVLLRIVDGDVAVDLDGGVTVQLGRRTVAPDYKKAYRSGVRRLERPRADDAARTAMAREFSATYDVSHPRVGYDGLASTSAHVRGLPESKSAVFHQDAIVGRGQLVATVRKKITPADAEHDPSLRDHVEQLPSSEVLFHLYQQGQTALPPDTAADRVPLATFKSQQISNPATKAVLRQCDPTSESCAPGTDDFLALLGTPNLAAAVGLLTDHGADLGIERIELIDYKSAGSDSWIKVIYAASS